MIKKLTCIECPTGCALSVDIENCKVVKVSGNKCPKGLGYAVTEIESPSRILTSGVTAEGLELKLIPVRTSRPIPKAGLLKAMEIIKRTRVSEPVRSGDVIIHDFLAEGTDLIATRAASLTSDI